MDPELAPHWVAVAARFNPVDWAVVASRQALSADPDWGSAGRHSFYLLAFTLIVGWLAVHPGLPDLPAVCLGPRCCLSF
jgi:ABC-2 type transport system permease protein